jgi:hypothetical protein
VVIRRSLGLICALPVLLATSRVWGEAPPLSLTWNAPPGCPSAADVRRQFEQLAKAPTDRPPPRLVADALVEQNAERWHLRLRIVRDGLAGEREVDAGSCVSLARAAALELALAFGGSFAPDPEPPAESATAPQNAPPVSAARPISWWATLDARYASGPLPGRTFGTAAGVDARYRSWLASARVVAWPGAREEPVPGIRTTFAGVGGSLSICFIVGSSPSVMLAGCGGLQASALRGSSSGGSVADSAVASWYAALPAVRARLRLVGNLSIDLGLESAISLTRPRFVVLGLNPPVYVVPQLAPTLSVGLSLQI